MNQFILGVNKTAVEYPVTIVLVPYEKCNAALSPPFQDIEILYSVGTPYHYIEIKSCFHTTV